MPTVEEIVAMARNGCLQYGQTTSLDQERKKNFYLHEANYSLRAKIGAVMQKEAAAKKKIEKTKKVKAELARMAEHVQKLSYQNRSLQQKLSIVRVASQSCKTSQASQSHKVSQQTATSPEKVQDKGSRTRKNKSITFDSPSPSVSVGVGTSSRANSSTIQHAWPLELLLAEVEKRQKYLATLANIEKQQEKLLEDYQKSFKTTVKDPQVNGNSMSKLASPPAQLKTNPSVGTIVKIKR